MSYIIFCRHIFFIDLSVFLKYVNYMPTKKPKLLLIVDDELLERIDDFRFYNRINSRSEAIRRLLNKALKKYEKKAKE
jgi:hypothetical protein